jgi:hypothetical protein
MSRIMIIMAVVLFSATFVGCGSKDSTELSTTNYISWGDSSIRKSTIADVRKDTIKVCLSGRVSNENYERSVEWSKRSMLIWMRVLKSIDVQVTESIIYTCDSPDLTWNLINGSGTSNASASRINIYMSRAFGTWTHELGHAFTGLGDTYSGRTAGSCRSGQPASLMCWGAYGPRKDPEEFSTLWSDDIAGAIANYKKIFRGDLEAPEWGEGFDHTQPLDADAPWPQAEPMNEIIVSEDMMNIVIDNSVHQEVFDDVNSVDL